MNHNLLWRAVAFTVSHEELPRLREVLNSALREVKS